MSADAPPALLEARDLTAILPGDAGPVRVLDGAGLALSAGEVVDLAGSSGAGKTTLLRALARLLPNASGSLTLRGVPAEQIAPEAWRSRVALLPQRPVIVAGDVASNLSLPWRLKARGGEVPPGMRRLREALDDVALGEVSLERDASRLSVGQQARVALVRVLLTCPDVLLLDEPDAALDPMSSEALAGKIREFAVSGGAVLRARHRGSDGLATRRLRIERGHLTQEGAR